MRLALLGFCMLVAASCRTTSSPVYDTFTPSELAEINAAIDDGAFLGPDHPRDTLSTSHRQLRSIKQQCGAFSGALKPFRGTSPGLRGYFTESVWRKMPSPRGHQGCRSNEVEENGFCWENFGLQFYPRAPSGVATHYLVDDISPIIRLIPQSEIPPDDRRCQFDRRSVLIWVGGIRNPEMGTTWQNTDFQLVSSLVAWNRTSSRPMLLGTQSPTDPGKLKERPGYIQLVPNDGAVMGGIQGRHDERAIRLLANNLQQAYRSGVNEVEVVSHSNGGITTQIGIQLFLKELADREQSWMGERSAAAANDRMQLRVFHLQAAPSQKWSTWELNKFGDNSDFLRNAKRVRKTRLGIPYWGWEWDFTVYEQAQKYLDAKIVYFYNKPDFWTFPILSIVGRPKSLAWQKELNAEGVSRGVSLPVLHFRCDKSEVAQCGPQHKQREVLWSFADPMQLIAWDLELETGLGGRAASAFAAPAGAAAGPESAADSAQVTVPESICLDVEVHSQRCTDVFNQTRASSSYLPQQVCSLASDDSDPCSQVNLGDGMCSLAEQDDAVLRAGECQLPRERRICECQAGGCQEIVVSCRDLLCSETITEAQECSCLVNKSRVECLASATYCQISEHGPETCSREMIFAAEPGALAQESCAGADCILPDIQALPAGAEAARAAFGSSGGFDVAPAESVVVPMN